MNPRDIRAFYDELAGRYDLLYADRDAGTARQSRALNGLLTAHPGRGLHRVLDNACSPDGRTISFQLWQWHEGGERYDLELFRLLPSAAPGGETWTSRTSKARYWALPEEESAGYARRAGFADTVWHPAEATGFHQPALRARHGAGHRLDRLTCPAGGTWTLWSPRRAGRPD
ncbi:MULTISPECIES: hypothetical protein [unclassified Streptomyces]|uniref:hypothetical protein n=1 Tax=unclassified Streptomyces TaxID=2593676 RepID=UPI0034482112